MDIKIKPVSFLIPKISKTKAKRQDSPLNNSKSPDYGATCALKNQILFKPQIKNKNSNISFKGSFDDGLNITPEVLEAIVNPKTSQEKVNRERYTKIGSQFSEALIKTELVKRFPLKNSDEIEKIWQKLSSKDVQRKALETLLSEDVIENLGPDFIFGLLGFVILKGEAQGEANGEQIASEFYNENYINALFEAMGPIEKNYLEEFNDFMESQGYNYDDIYIRRKIYASKHEYTVYYKDLILSVANGRLDDDSVKKRAVNQARIEVKLGMELDRAGDNLPYNTHKTPEASRRKWLMAFSNKYNLVFNDLNLLHRAFLSGVMSDKTTVSKEDSNQKLQYLGHAVLEYVISKAYPKYHPGYDQTQLSEGIAEACSEETIAKVAKMSELEQYCTSPSAKSSPAKLFEGLIGAVYLDSDGDGFEQVLKFLDGNFKKEIFKDGDMNVVPASYPKEKIIEFLIEKYNLKLTAEELNFVFSQSSLFDPDFKIYKGLGEQILQCYLRKEAQEEYPQKPLGVLARISEDYESERVRRTFEELFASVLDKEKDPKQNYFVCDYFYALVGLMAEKNGYRDVENFLNKYAKKSLFKEVEASPKSKVEQLYSQILKNGCSPRDLYIETKRSPQGYLSNIYYRERLFAKSFNTGGRLQDAKEAALETALKRISNKEHLLRAEKKSNIRDYRKADYARQAHLSAFAKRYGLSFQDINLLHQAFLFNDVQGVSVHYFDSYEPLEYIGDAVLEYCVQKIVAQNAKKDSSFDYYRNVQKRAHAFTSNENLIKIGKRMQLDKYSQGFEGHKTDDKRYADIFEAILGAIYLDGGKYGLEKAYGFIKENFEDEILSIKV